MTPEQETEMLATLKQMAFILNEMSIKTDKMIVMLCKLADKV